MEERGLFELYELYAEDPEKADFLIWGRKSDPSTRRGFLGGAGLLSLTAAIGAPIAFSEFFPSGLIPQAFASENMKKLIQSKKGLTILNDRPLNLETPPHLLNDEITPESRLFVRNNGLVPEIALTGDISKYILTIDGEVERPLKLSLEDLKRKFKHYTRHYVLECGGNGRAAFYPPTKGNQWTYGAVGCPLWKGVLLKDVLELAGVKKSAVYTGYYGMDAHLSGDPNKVPISRGTPIEKALDGHTMLAWEMNGKPLPALHGFPLRILAPGYPASASGKWVERITIRDKVHDGPKMLGYAYRVPKRPVASGAKVDKADMKIIEEMPVKSLITFPKSGLKLTGSKENKVKIAGFAWTAQERITKVDLTFDFGQTYIQAKVSPARNRFGWQRFEKEIVLPQKGYFEVWSRATDSSGKMQPMVVPGWNPKGYLNNAMPRIAVTIG